MYDKPYDLCRWGCPGSLPRREDKAKLHDLLKSIRPAAQMAVSAYADTDVRSPLLGGI